MSTLDEYLALVEKVDKRFRNEKLVELLARAELTHRADFTSKNKGDLPEKIAALQAQLKEMADGFQIKLHDPVQDEEHHTWSLCFTDGQGAIAMRRLGGGIESRVPADDGEVHADQGLPGAAVSY